MSEKQWMRPSRGRGSHLTKIKMQKCAYSQGILQLGNVYHYLIDTNDTAKKRYDDKIKHTLCA